MPNVSEPMPKVQLHINQDRIRGHSSCQISRGWSPFKGFHMSLVLLYLLNRFSLEIIPLENIERRLNWKMQSSVTEVHLNVQTYPAPNCDGRQ